MMDVTGSLDFLGEEIEVVMDRPMGSRHPRFGFVYPVNYGFIAGTKSGDGKELDAYVLGVDHAVESFRGVCIAVIKRWDDDDDKLVVVPRGTDIDDDTIREQTYFQEQFFTSQIERRRQYRHVTDD